MKITTALFSLIFFGSIATVQNRTYHPVPKSIPTDEIMNSKIDTLKLPKGFPTENTAHILEDELVYVHGIDAYMKHCIQHCIKGI